MEARRAHVGARAEARRARLAQRAALRVEQCRVHAARHDVVRQVARAVDDEEEALAPMARGRGRGRLVAGPRGLGHAEVVEVVDGRGAVLLLVGVPARRHRLLEALHLLGHSALQPQRQVPQHRRAAAARAAAARRAAAAEALPPPRHPAGGWRARQLAASEPGEHHWRRQHRHRVCARVEHHRRRLDAAAELAPLLPPLTAPAAAAAARLGEEGQHRPRHDRRVVRRRDLRGGVGQLGVRRREAELLGLG